jgi:hypothetical protein
MPNITTISSFTSEPLKIPVAVNESAGIDNNAGLDKVITESERKLLKSILGDAQYAQLQTELSKLPFNPQSGSNADQNYIDLVNGSGIWQGIRPMLDNFIFCAWLKATEVTLTHIGSGKGQTQGFTVADNSGKYVDRWNIFVDEYEDVLDYISKSDFFEYEIQENPFDFLTGDQKGDYGYINSLGI